MVEREAGQCGEEESRRRGGQEEAAFDTQEEEETEEEWRLQRFQRETFLAKHQELRDEKV